jgi:alanyl aminopeptidase
MFESWMGPDAFQKGVQSYLKQYEFRATTAGDFLDSLSSASKQDVTSAFSTFLNQPGVPVVSVALDCKTGKPVLRLTQHRSLPLGSKETSPESWKIPLCIRYGAGKGPGKSECLLMTQPAETHDLSGGCPDWVQANDRAVGYYRVDYQDGLLAKLTSGDFATRLPATERVDLMGDVQALALSGTLPTSEALSLAETFHDDPAHYVVERALDVALAPAQNLVPADLLPNYQRFLRKNFDARARSLGWTPKPGESEDTAELRPVLLQAMATRGADTQLAAEARSLAEKWLGDRTSVDPNLSGAVLIAAAYNGDKALFDRYMSELKKTRDRQDRRRILAALPFFRDPAALEGALTALATGEIPFIESPNLVFAGQQQPETRKIPLHFLETHWDALVSKMPTGGGFDFGSRLPRVGANYCDAASRDELKTFFTPRVQQFTGAPRELDQAVEAISDCVANKTAQEPGVAAFLSKY